MRIYVQPSMEPPSVDFDSDIWVLISFFTGCSMFLPVFDAAVDTYEALHERSPFCVNAICMIAAKVRDGGGPPSDTYQKCLKQVHDLTCRTLFAPVVRQEVVQAMIIVAGWGAGPKDSGWLTCGHATRMALELGWFFSPAVLTHLLMASFYDRDTQSLAAIVEAYARWKDVEISRREGARDIF